jgi:hypothetical protein
MWAVVAAPWAWSEIWAAGAFAYPWAAETTMWTAAGKVGTAAEATETAAGAILRLICVGVREVGECRRCWWNFYNVTIFQMTISNDLGKLSKQTIHFWAKESIHREMNQTISLSFIRSRKKNYPCPFAQLFYFKFKNTSSLLVQYMIYLLINITFRPYCCVCNTNICIKNSKIFFISFF